MNCSQARAELATYRELNKDLTDIPELKEHLAHCAECSETFSQFQAVGERIRSTPQIQPPPDAHQKVMQALAAEHVRYLQRTPASATTTPTPAFLVPYLKDLAQQQPDTKSLAAFSSANTGPLSVLKTARPRHLRQMSHMTIIGLAASFLMVVMMGGLLSLLFLANQGKSGTNLGENSDILHRTTAAQASLNAYQTTSTYPHIASASEVNGTIYYSAYNADKTSWMLQTFSSSKSGSNGQPGSSTSLLSAPSAYPIILLGGDQNWLFWLQMEAQKNIGKKNTSSSHNETPPGSNTSNPLVGNWSLKALYLGTDTTAAPSRQADNSSPARAGDTDQTPSYNATNQTTPTTQPQTLQTGTFNPSIAPDWVTSPIQGLSFYRDHVLIALIDSKGISHLLQYQLNQNNISLISTLANASNDHILTSPTATSNGDNIYWSEEWLATDHDLSSNIWTIQTTEAPLQQPGRWTPHTQAQSYLYRDDGNSFRPQIVNDTLFWINKSAGEKIALQNGESPAQATSTGNNAPTQAATSTSLVQSTATATSQTTSNGKPDSNITDMLGSLTNADPTVLVPQLDQQATGQLMAYTADGVTPTSTTIGDSDSANVSNIEAGSNYLIWQNKDGLAMYDVTNKIMVNGINDIDSNSSFIVADGNTIIATDYLVPGKDQSTTGTQVQFQLLQWPK